MSSEDLPVFISSPTRITSTCYHACLILVQTSNPLVSTSLTDVTSATLTFIYSHFMPADLCVTFNTLKVFALASSLIRVTRYSTRGPWTEELFILAHVSVHHGKEGRVEFMKAGACGRVWSRVGRSGGREVEPESEAGTASKACPQKPTSAI